MENPVVELILKENPKATKEAFHRHYMPMYLLGLFIAVFFCIPLAPNLLWWDELDWEVQVMEVFWLGSMLFMFVFPSLSHQLSKCRIRKLYPEGIPDVLVQFGDTILLTSGKNRVEYQYDWIARTKKYRYSYALCFKHRSELRLGYNSYTKGDFETLKALLRENCPNAKIKD